MLEKEIRLKCLELAAHFYGPGEPPPEFMLFQLADSYLSYVNGSYAIEDQQVKKE